MLLICLADDTSSLLITSDICYQGVVIATEFSGYNDCSPFFVSFVLSKLNGRLHGIEYGKKRKGSHRQVRPLANCTQRFETAFSLLNIYIKEVSWSEVKYHNPCYYEASLFSLVWIKQHWSLCQNHSSHSGREQLNNEL